MPYYLGAPVWACDRWATDAGGPLYSTPNRRRWLGEYSTVFNTVEGNSTFYGLPDLPAVERWAADTADGFRFALKFPSAITHERELLGAERETDDFLDRLAILRDADRLGPTLLQLPPYFAGDQLANLAAYLDRLPDWLPVAVEARHADYFDGADVERALDRLLAGRGADRALFDSRPLFSAPPSDPIEQASQSRKPRSPFRTTVTGRSPMVRLVGRNHLPAVDPWINEWAAVVGGWIEQGLTPYFFTHAPDDTLAPAFAERFHQELQRRSPSLHNLPEWPGRAAPRQQSLF